jgi:anti-sigma regulatory factor (Ser/Thr protein kinase)
VSYLNARDVTSAATWQLAREVGSAMKARTATRGFLHDAGRANYDDDPAVLVVSELVANAALHAHPGVDTIEMSLELRGTHLHIEVRDADPRPPVEALPRPEDEHGRGLLIVDRMTERWGWNRLSPHGKRVWCDMNV